MKEKLINLKDKIVDLAIDVKNKIVPVIIANKILSIIISIVVFVLILIIILISNKTDIGNTTGNLNNLGFSVQNNGWIYYLGLENSLTDGIYKVKLNGDKKEKISDDHGIYLNKSGKYLYYLDIDDGEHNIVKIKMNGEDKETVVEDADTERITVIDNNIYYFKNSNFYKAKTNGENKQVLSKKSIENYEIVGDWIYYSYINDGKFVIAKMTTNGENITKINSNAGKVFFANENNIYYIYENYDEDKYEYNYELYKMKTDGDKKEKVAKIDGELNIDTINFSENRIYYAKLDEEGSLGIYSIKLNGKDEIKITDIEANSTMINVHKNWVYYTDKNENGDSHMYKIKTNGKDKQLLSK